MRNYTLNFVLLSVGLLLIIFSGCSVMMYNERAISLEEVIDLSKAEVGPDVIISHIDATNTIFKLTSEDIIMLKEEGVDDDVIEHILETDIDSGIYNGMNSTLSYDYYSNRYSGYPYYGGLSLYSSPYYVRRTPGLVGRFYEYAPSVPLYSRDYFPRSGSRRNLTIGRTQENNGDGGNDENDGENNSQRRDTDNNNSSQQDSDSSGDSGNRRAR
ncbi:hypothetical protein ACFL6K_02195 [Candidatus Latescibacterota bacterium]